MSESSHASASPAGTLADALPKRLSLTHKLILFLMICFAQFLDAFNNAALVAAIPTLFVAMGITRSQSTWIVSAYQLTFASFLLIVCFVTFLRRTLTRT